MILQNHLIKDSLNIQTKTSQLYTINQDNKFAFRIQCRRNYHFPETAVKNCVYSIGLKNLTPLDSDSRKVLGKLFCNKCF